MQKQKVSPNVQYMGNLAVLSACLELGVAAVQNVMGGDAVSTQLQGEDQSARDIQDMIGARLIESLGV